MSVRLRKKDELFKFSIEDELYIFKRVGPVDFNRLVQIPTYKWCYQRYYTILDDKKNNESGRKNDTVTQLAKELVEVYMYCDLCPKSIKAIKNNLEKRIKNLEGIRFKDSNHKTEKYIKQSKTFLKDLNWGIDILSPGRQEYLGITLGEDELNLFNDNCVPYTDSNGNQVVKYIAKIEGKKHPSAKKAQKRLERLHKLDVYYSNIKKSAELMNAEEEMTIEEDTKLYVGDDEDEWKETKKKRRLSSPLQDYSKSLRSIGDPSTSTVPEENHSDEFPKIPLRESFKTFNPTLLELLARLECKWRLPARVSREVFVDISNTFFNQKYEIRPEKTIVDKEEELLEEDKCDWSFIMPDRKTLRNYIEDAAILNFNYVAETIVEAKEKGSVVTLGTDDTVKLAGESSFDVKTGIVTVIGESEDGCKERKTLSLGHKENLSHEGIDSAKTVRTFLSQVGACIDLKEEEVLDNV